MDATTKSTADGGVDAYKCMRNNSEIRVLTNFDEVERIFSSILERFDASKEPCLCVGLDLEWKPKVVYGEWHTHQSSSVGDENNHEDEDKHEHKRKRKHDMTASGTVGGEEASEQRKENPVSMLQITVFGHNDHGGFGGFDNDGAVVGLKQTYLIRMLQVFDITRCIWTHPNEQQQDQQNKQRTENGSTSTSSDMDNDSASSHISYESCALFRFLSHPRVLKFGVGITGDKKKLHNDFCVWMQGTVELGKFLQKVTLYRHPEENYCGDNGDNNSNNNGIANNATTFSAPADTASITNGTIDDTASIATDVTNSTSSQSLSSNDTAATASTLTPLLISPASSLARIVQAVCGIFIPKDKAVQCGDWEAVELKEEQIMYAASDSYHALLVCEAVLKEAQDPASANSSDKSNMNERDNVKMSQSELAQRLSFGLVDSGVVRGSVDTAAYAAAVSKLRAPASSASSTDTDNTDSGSGDTTDISDANGTTGTDANAEGGGGPRKKVCRLRASRSPIYESCALISNDGKFLSYCDQKRLNWYLRKDLAEEVDTDTIAWYVAQNIVDASVLTASGRMVQLRFEARGTGNRDDSYKRQKLLNKCVVCGLVQEAQYVQPNIGSSTPSNTNINTNTKSNVNSHGVALAPNTSPNADETFQLLHHHVVPRAYRRVFPSCMVSKNNHDVLPICKLCKAAVAQIYANKMQVLELTYVPQAVRDDLVAARRCAQKPGPLRSGLHKIQALCASLLQTAPFTKRVKTVNPDGTKRVDKVSLEPEKNIEVKKQMMESLHIWCGKLTMEEDCSKDPVLISLRDQGMALTVEANEPDRIRAFLSRYEQLAEEEITEREREKERVRDAAATATATATAAASADLQDAEEEEVHEEDEDKERCTGINKNVSLVRAVEPRKTMEGQVLASYIHPLSLNDPLSTYIHKLHEFESMWRQFFLDAAAPRHLPPHWDVNYKHQHNQDPSSY